jgi:hypothetical protein
MGKIRLEMEALSVESFAPADTPALRGTVRGMASLYWEDCQDSETCPGGYPCDPTDQSCGGTCYEGTCAPGGCGGGTYSAGCSMSCPSPETCIEQTVYGPDC